MLTQVSERMFPCCGHCEYPGCPQWRPWHDIRCWRCLKELLCTHSENTRQPVQMDGYYRWPTITETQDEFIKFVEALDAAAYTRSGQ
jgi:hypothetical protein